jgi:hypothetical protein
MKFKNELEAPEAAARELLRIAKSLLKEGVGHTYTGIANSQFLYTSCGSLDTYKAGRDFAIAKSWFKIDESGTRIFVLPEGMNIA